MTEHDRYRKQLANRDVNNMCASYENKCTYHGSLKLSKEQICEYLKASDKNKYLASIGKCFA